MASLPILAYCMTILPVGDYSEARPAAKGDYQMTEVLERVTVGEELADRLRRLILAGEFRPGDPLRESHLAERYDVSRPSVRDAIRRLVHEGLVQHETHRGARVARLEESGLRDILLVRMIIEPAVVRRFGTTPESGARLRAIVEDLEAAVEARDWPGYAEADIDFHETLVAAAASPRLTELHGRAMRQLRLHLTSADLADERPIPDRHDVGEHRLIAQQLAADEREDAARLLSSHLEDALAAVVGVDR